MKEMETGGILDQEAYLDKLVAEEQAERREERLNEVCAVAAQRKAQIDEMTLRIEELERRIKEDDDEKEQERVLAEQRGLTGCEECEFAELRVQVEDDAIDDFYYARCADCCRFDNDQPHDLFTKKIIHRGIHYDRVEAPGGEIEKALAKRWERKCARYAYTGLEVDFTTGELIEGFLHNSLLVKRDEQIAIKVTQDVATACADVVQWMGTNCGLAFLQQAFYEAGYMLRWEKR